MYLYCDMRVSNDNSVLIELLRSRVIRQIWIREVASFEVINREDDVKVLMGTRNVLIMLRGYDDRRNHLVLGRYLTLPMNIIQEPASYHWDTIARAGDILSPVCEFLSYCGAEVNKICIIPSGQQTPGGLLLRQRSRLTGLIGVALSGNRRAALYRFPS